MERANLKELAKKAIEAKDPEKFGSVAIGYLMLVNDFIGEFSDLEAPLLWAALDFMAGTILADMDVDSSEMAGAIQTFLSENATQEVIEHEPV